MEHVHPFQTWQSASGQQAESCPVLYSMAGRAKARTADMLHARELELPDLNESCSQKAPKA